ncbi:MAG: hypothetical protein ACI4JK_00335 [Oscillospiraceae bacterium]
MEIKAKIGNVDYDNIIKNALPLLKEKNDSRIVGIISGIINMPGELPLKMIAAIPQETKNELVAYIINAKKEAIINIISESLEKRGFSVEITDLEIISE